MPDEKADQLAHMETLGSIAPGCAGCVVFYKAPRPSDVMAPRHAPSKRCESGGRAHCTCSRCF